MQGVFGLALILLLASCSCSMQQMMPWKMTDYFDLESQNNDYETAFFGNDEQKLLGSAKSMSFNVMNYGAAGNGQTDDSEAFKKAWSDVCGATSRDDAPTLLAPEGKTFVVNPVVFMGPCKSSIRFQIQGTLTAPQTTSWSHDSFGSLIQFRKVDNLIVEGSGTIDGQGARWWNACIRKSDFVFGNKVGCQQRPAVLVFSACNGLQLKGLTHVNSPRAHVVIHGSKDITISDIKISAPEKSPNTDGIDISTSSNIKIQDSTIATGDDCVAINGGTSFVNITGVKCGPGHGISIGSLGDGGDFDTVEEVHVSNCQLIKTTNGVRIKTFQGASGYARKISFEHIRLENVENPIIIDQHYEDKSKRKPQLEFQQSKVAAIKVSDITYSDLHGTSNSDYAINLNCDDNVGCSGIKMKDVDITSAVPGKSTLASCQNAHGTADSTQPKVPCL
ncbi:Glycoside hydrolase, family 28 [Corchorus olitorius]|uniref:Glycoside hydrolase, family 28 n=1 Tax=Corchorus olitorius TaxID=93759 RepID=A0A1R3J0U2_9ROSI|nr:Glycoside hydrolase, family 28 [Corchorus olitorius]